MSWIAAESRKGGRPRRRAARGVCLAAWTIGCVWLGGPRLATAAAVGGVEALAPERHSEPVTLRLHEAQREALARHPAAHAAQARVARFAARLAVAQAGFDTTLSGAVRSAEARTPRVAEADLIAGSDRRASAELSLTRALEIGGTLSATFSQGRADTTIVTAGGQGGTAPLTTHFGSIGVGWVLPLLRGFGTKSALASRRAAEVERLGAELEWRGALRTIWRDVTTAYWEGAHADAELQLRRALRQDAERLRGLSQQLVATGRLASSEQAAAESVVRLRRAEEVAAAARLRGRLAALWRALGRTEGDASPAWEPLPEPAPRPWRELQAIALAHDPELAALRAALEALAHRVAFARDRRLPQLDAQLGAGTASRATRAGENWTQLGRFDAPYWSAALVLQVPLENRAARGAWQELEAMHEELVAGLAQRRLDVAAQLIEVSAALDAAIERLQLAREAEQFAEQNLQAERDRLQAGRTSMSDVVLRQQELRDARLLTLRSHADGAVAATWLDSMVQDPQRLEGAWSAR